MAETPDGEGFINDPPLLRDFVALSNGLQGEVVGFYHRTAGSIVLRLQTGECIEAPLTDVERRLTAPADEQERFDPRR